MTAGARLGTAKTGEPAFGTRGVVEGFYGKPWTHPQRIDMIEFIAERGMNTFMYAPKDDPLIRRDWRQPYAGAQLERLGELVETCSRRGVEFVYCISPGLSIEYSSDGDLDAVLAKLASVAALGVRSFGLLLDDIPTELQHPADRERFSSLVDAHAHVITAVYDGLLAADNDHSLIVCPTVYWGYGDEDYIARLGRSIDPRIDVLWTGRAICSATIDLADAATVTRSLARPVTYWDNYPVNDVAMGGELHIGPYRGRDRHLYRFADGVIANGMSLFESSKIAFATIADYLWAPETYDPEASWLVAIRDVLGNDADAAAFAVFADNVRSSCLSEDDAPVVSTAIERFDFLLSQGKPAEASAVLGDVADRMLLSAAHLSGHAVANRAIVDESAPWLDAFAIGAHALRFMADRCAAAALDDETVAGLTDFLARFRATGRRVYGDTLEMTLTTLIDTATAREGDG